MGTSGNSQTAMERPLTSDSSNKALSTLHITCYNLLPMSSGVGYTARLGIRRKVANNSKLGSAAGYACRKNEKLPRSEPARKGMAF